MSLGVLNNITAVYAENNLNNTNNSLNTVLQQLSSGSKINSGADDAAGLSLVDGLQANQQALTQSVTNATEGVGLLQVADGALSQVTSLLNRAVTLATEASNGTLNSSQDTAANQEYQSILSEISNIGSTTTYNDTAVFGKSVNIYTGDASTAGSSIDALNVRSLSSSNVGDSGGVMSYSNGANNVFVNLSTSTANAQATDTLNGGTNGSTTINVNYLVKGANGAETTATTSISVGAGTSYTNTANGLMSAINGAGLGLTATFATQAQAGVQGGGTQTGIEITGGLVSVGMDPNSASTSGVVNFSGTAANELLTQGQSLTIQTGTNAAHTIAVTSSGTLGDLAGAINAQDSDVNATVITNGDGTQSLSVANKNANAGALTVTPSVVNAAPISMAFNSTSTGATGGFATGTLGFGAVATSSASEVVAGNIVLSNSGTPGANPVTFVMGAGSDATPNGTIHVANYGDGSLTLGNLASAIQANLGVTTSVGASGISMTSNSSGTTIEAGANALTASPSLGQTGNVGGLAATVGSDGSTTFSVNGIGSGALGTDTLAVGTSIVLTNGNATNAGTTTTFTIGNGGTGVLNAGTADVTTSVATVDGLIAAINADRGTSDISSAAALNSSGQLVLSSTTVGTTISVANGAGSNTLADTPVGDPITGTGTGLPTLTSAGDSNGASFTMNAGEIHSNPIVPGTSDTVAGTVILGDTSNGVTTNWTFTLGGSNAPGTPTLVAAHDYSINGDTLADMATEINTLTSAGVTTNITATMNSDGTGLTFATTAPGVHGHSLTVDSSGLTDTSNLSFTKPAGGDITQYQTGVVSLTDGGQLPGLGDASTGTLVGSIKITNNNVTDTFVMGQTSQVLAADNGTINVDGSTLNDLIGAITAENGKTGTNIDLSASQDPSTGGLFLQSTTTQATDLQAVTTGLTDTLSESSTNGSNGIAGLGKTAAAIAFSNGGVNSLNDVLTTATTIGLTNTSSAANGSVVYGTGAGEVTFIVGGLVSGDSPSTIYTGSSAAEETVGGLMNAINTASTNLGLSLNATFDSKTGLTVTSSDNTSTIAQDATGGYGLTEAFGVSQGVTTGGTGPTNATYANATVGITGGLVGSSDALSGSIVLNNNVNGTLGTAQTFVMNSTGSKAGAVINTSGLTIQDLANAINSDGALGLNAIVANGALSLQAGTAGVDSIIVGTGANDNLADKVTATASSPDTGAPGALSTANLTLAGGVKTALGGDTITGSIALTGSGGTKTFVMGGHTLGATIGVGSSAGGETLQDLASAISTSGIGITAGLAPAGTGLSLTGSTDNATTISQTGNNLQDATTTAPLSYASSSAYNVGISNSNLHDTSTGQASTGLNTNFVANSSASSGVATIGYTDGAGVSLAASDLSSQQDAQSSLTSLNSAITAVAAQDGYIGAQINTLNAVSQVLSTQQENVQAAQNAVQATDYASATSNMSKYEILSQTGIAALAQANSIQQEVTKLLQ